MATALWAQHEESQQHEYQGQTVRREAGQKVSGVLMRQWRPELFQADEVLVWSQPSAVVDQSYTGSSRDWKPMSTDRQ